MNQFQVLANEYLSRNTNAFYHVPYTGMRNPGNPDYLNDLKNTFNDFSEQKLQSAVQELRCVLQGDLPQVFRSLGFDTMTVCVVPRAKAEESYHANQQLFRSTVQATIGQIDGLVDGTSYMRRHTNTKTTHLRNPVRNYIKDHRVRVWVIFGANVVERRTDTGFRGYPMLSEFGMMFGWQTQRSDSGGCGMRMRSLVFVRYTRCAASSVIRKRVSSLLYGAQKNCLRDLWSHGFGLVRPQQAPGSGSVQRRHPHLSRVRSTARAVPQLWPSEARAPRIHGRQPLLY